MKKIINTFAIIAIIFVGVCTLFTKNDAAMPYESLDEETKVEILTECAELYISDLAKCFEPDALTLFDVIPRGNGGMIRLKLEHPEWPELNDCEFNWTTNIDVEDYINRIDTTEYYNAGIVCD